MSIQQHREFLRIPFRDDSLLQNMDVEDAKILHKYGAWLEALLHREIEPTTDAQRHFIEIFTNGGKIRTVYERAWNNYLMERRYVRAISFCGEDYSEARNVIMELARKGHSRAIQWIKSEGAWNPHPPPDPGERNGYAKIIWDETYFLGRQVDGSYGG